MLAHIAPTAVSANSADAPLAPTALQASAAFPEVRAFESELEVLIRNNDTEAMISALRSLEIRGDLSQLVRSRLIYSTLMSFARVTETAAARSQIEPWLAREPAIHIWHEEGSHRVPVPAFDPAAAAAFALSAWNDRAWHRRAAAGLREGSTAFLSEWLSALDAGGGKLSPAGLVSAFQQATPDQLAAWPARFEALLGKGAPVGEMAAIVATRLRSQQLALAIVDDADTLSALRFMDAFSGQVDAGGETDVLARALRRQDLASAALYRLGRLDSHDARGLLLSQLASPEHGGSAAAALARRISPDLIESLAALIRSDSNMLTRRRAVLALGLAPGSAGHQALATLRTEAGLPDDLRSLMAKQLP